MRRRSSRSRGATSESRTRAAFGSSAQMRLPEQVQRHAETSDNHVTTVFMCCPKYGAPAEHARVVGDVENAHACEPTIQKGAVLGAGHHRPQGLTSCAELLKAPADKVQGRQGSR